MKKKICFLLFFLCFCFSISFGQDLNKKKIEIEAKVVKLGTPPKIRSGFRRHVYQLVKYEVIKVLSGKYKDKYIVVDHLVFSGDELSNLKEGDLVIMEVFPRRKISLITKEIGIREVIDNINIFYIPGKIKKIGRF